MVREIDVWAESPRLSPLWLSASSSACHGLLIITVITPLPTKPSATKMPENWSWRTRQITGHADASAWCCCARCKIHEGVSRMRSWKWCSARWCCRWSSSVAHRCSPSVSAKPPPPPAWIMQPPSTGRHRWTGLFHPSRGWSLCKNNWKEPRSILMSSVGAAHIDGQIMQLLWAIHTRFQRSINAQHKTEQSIYECLLGFLF